MKNKEKYAKQILDIACDGYSVGINKKTGTPFRCEEETCTECAFDGRTNNCRIEINGWANSQYIEKPKLTKNEKSFLDCLDKDWVYMTEDQVGSLRVHKAKPIKGKDVWVQEGRFSDKNISGLVTLNFKMVSWWDKEPWLIEDLKNLEVVDELSIGDKVQCISNGVIGYVFKFYEPISCAEQTMVRTLDGQFYHAPTTDWRKVR